MKAPPSEYDRKHSVRIMFGNGLRASIWKEFVTRFKIKDIAEFYGSTEGNANAINVENKVGAVGFLTHFLPRIFMPLYIISVDKATGEPLRGPDGYCTPSPPGRATADSSTPSFKLVFTRSV